MVGSGSVGVEWRGGMDELGWGMVKRGRQHGGGRQGLGRRHGGHSWVGEGGAVGDGSMIGDGGKTGSSFDFVRNLNWLSTIV
nr:hypothetical protein [Tanacetum cinerariifolium]